VMLCSHLMVDTRNSGKSFNVSSSLPAREPVFLLFPE
jgi:hypothetical protein